MLARAVAKSETIFEKYFKADSAHLQESVLRVAFGANVRAIAKLYKRGRVHIGIKRQTHERNAEIDAQQKCVQVPVRLKNSASIDCCIEKEKSNF